MESLAKRMNMTPEQVLMYLLRCYKEDPKVSDFAEAWRIQFEYALRTQEEVNFVFPTGIKWDANAIPLIAYTIEMRDAVVDTWHPWNRMNPEEIEERIDFERFISVASGKYKD